MHTFNSTGYIPELADEGGKKPKHVFLQGIPEGNGALSI